MGRWRLGEILCPRRGGTNGGRQGSDKGAPTIREAVRCPVPCASRDKGSSPDAPQCAPATLPVAHDSDVARLREVLSASGFGELAAALSDEYLCSVLAVPGRSFEHAAKKMVAVMEWRAESRVAELRYEEVERELRSGSMYWHGYDWAGRPILWVRPALKDWKRMDSEQEIRAHAYLIEMGCQKFLHPGVTTFTLVTDSSGLGLGQLDLRLMRGLADVGLRCYPDRAGKICIGPVSSLVTVLEKVLHPLLPLRLRQKIVFMNDPLVALRHVIPEDLIPTYMGGGASHQPGDSAGGAYDNDAMIGAQLRRRAALLASQGLPALLASRGPPRPEKLVSGDANPEFPCDQPLEKRSGFFCGLAWPLGWSPFI